MSDLETRNKLKKKKPVFSRQDSHKKSKLGTNWRKSRGLQSKMRLKKRGYARSISIGWKSPVSVRGLTREGLKMRMVSQLADLEGVDKKTEIVQISSGVGMKKKLSLLEAAQKEGVAVAHISDIASFIKEQNDKSASKKKESSEKKKARTAKKAKTEEKKEEKTAEKKEETAEEKQIEEKKEKDKVLTQKS